MMKVLLILALMFSLPAGTTDVTGQWKGNVSEQFDVTVFFETKANKVSARVQSQIGETVFTDGKMYGDSLAFTDQTFNGITIAALKGKVSGETINFVVDFQGQALKGVLTRVK